MIQLPKILENIRYTTSADVSKCRINSIRFDSRKCQPDDLFVCLVGSVEDGHQYIDQAISKGACAIVCEKLPSKQEYQIIYLKVDCSKKVLGLLAHNYFKKPSNYLKLVGITGTNGKTTTSTLLYHLYQMSKKKAGLISTVEIRRDNHGFSTDLTTPDPIEINYHLRQMVDSGIDYCFIEVSSHGLDQHRTWGLNFSGGVFTNLSKDHLDYHSSFSEYRDIKKSFFDSLSDKAFALTNIDDRNGMYMLQNCKAKKYTYSITKLGDFRAKILEAHFDGTHVEIDSQRIWTSLVGSFNVYNLLATYATATILGFSSEVLPKYLSDLKSVSGRFQMFQAPNKIKVIIDFAHTPDALEKVLNTINKLKSLEQNIITVIGCGGDRDQKKRPLMGKIATTLSQKVIFTSDNPRSEDSLKIIAQMQSGVKKTTDLSKVSIVSDRMKAIQSAKVLAKADDIVLIAGKGHERYQEIGEQRFLFDDYDIAREIFLNHV